MTVDETKALVLRAHQAFVAGDMATLETVLAPECVLHQCGFLEPLRGDRLRDLIRGGLRLSQRRSWIEAVVAEGDTVAICWTTTGRHTNFLIREPTGRQLTFSSTTFIRVEGDRIAEIWNIQDTASLATQLAEEATASR